MHQNVPGNFSKYFCYIIHLPEVDTEAAVKGTQEPEFSRNKQTSPYGYNLAGKSSETQQRKMTEKDWKHIPGVKGRYRNTVD